MIKRFFAEEEGQTLVEYGLLISLIALVVIAVLTLMGKRISNMMSLRTGQPIEAAKTYSVSGWASVNEGTQGPPVWDVVEKYVAGKKVVRVAPNTSVKVIGA